MQYGSAEHAYAVTEGRFPGIRDGLQWLTYAHLPEKLQKFSEVFYEAAVDLLNRIETDSPELTTAINKLIEAKDSAMRAGIRHDTGRAGSVPRPQEVVAPPSLTGTGDVSTPSDVCKHGVSRELSPAGWKNAHLDGVDCPRTDGNLA